MSRRDDEEADLATLLADLERTLTELQSAVDEDVRPRRRPPTPGEILRFTEEYTLPTVIALLEATVQSLELLRAVLRLAGPRPTEDRLRERLSSRESPDVATLRDALTDLHEALTGADLPEESAAGSILAEARTLTEEIDDRLADATQDSRRRASAGREGLAIDVREEGSSGDADAGSADDADVDVDAELASLKESMGEDEERRE